MKYVGAQRYWFDPERSDHIARQRSLPVAAAPRDDLGISLRVMNTKLSQVGSSSVIGVSV
jgi:hypothetical protein